MKLQNNSKMALLSERKKELYAQDSKVLKYYRANPVQACKDLLGIELLDEQKYLLQMTWTTPYNVWCCSRNFG